MAIDPALVGFDVVDTLQDTLLNYVMANRRMELQNRQFNAQMQLQKDQLKDSRERFDINTGFRTKAEQDAMTARKADKAFFSSLLLSLIHI